MKGSRLNLLAVAVPLVMILVAPSVGRTHGGVPHLVSFVSIDDPGFTFLAIGGVGHATLDVGSYTIDCIQVTTFDLQSQLVQARGRSGTGVRYFTFYGNGLLRGDWAVSPTPGQPCDAAGYYYGDLGLGVIAP